MVNEGVDFVYSGPVRFLFKLISVIRGIYRRTQALKCSTFRKFKTRCQSDGAENFAKSEELTYFGIGLIVTDLPQPGVECEPNDQLIREINAPHSKRARGRLQKSTPLVIWRCGGDRAPILQKTCYCRIINLSNYDWDISRMMSERMIEVFGTRPKFHVSFSSHTIVECLVICIGVCQRTNSRCAGVQLLLGWTLSYYGLCKSAPSVFLEISVPEWRCSHLKRILFL